MVALVTPPDYPIIRSLLRAEEDDLPDGVIIAPGIVAERIIRQHLGDAAVDGATGPRLMEIEQAANYMTASILAPTMRGSAIDVTNLRVGDTSMTRATANWDEVAGYLYDMAMQILDGPAKAEDVMGYSSFRRVKDAKFRGRVEGVETIVS